MYTVQRGDTLYSIAKKLNIPWQTLQSWNKGAVPTATTPLKVGAQLYSTRPPGYGSSPAADLVKNVPVNAPKAFTEFLPWETFFPEKNVSEFTASQIDPEYRRQREQQVRDFDWRSAIGNAFRTGRNVAQRQALNDEISRARNAAYADLFAQQKGLFTNAYGSEEEKYMADPTKYVAPKTGKDFPDTGSYMDYLKNFVS